tara:strand:+ start:98240 stop:98350 length:111 start_codon:yes stop_codon:yes gene_type:complete
LCFQHVQATDEPLFFGVGVLMGHMFSHGRGVLIMHG